VSKKTRPRRSAPSSKTSLAGVSTAKAATAKAATAKAATARAATAKAGPPNAAAGASGGGEAEAILGRVLAKLWTAIEAGEPLHAELETITCMAIPYAAGQREPESIDTFMSAVLVDGAARQRSPDGAALLRLLMALGTAKTKRAASRALAELTGAGIYPPDWVTEIGKPVPRRAWRRYDVFGDDEALLVTFSYGDVEHAVVVQVDLTGIPVATAAGVAPDPAGLIEAINRDTEEFERQEQISLTEARRRMEDPVARCEEGPELPIDTVIHLPMVRARVRRLPGAEFDPGPQFTAADRAAAVDDFMKSPLAADAVAADEESTRFWAQVLTGYSSRIDGEAPAQVGPRKLAHLLLGHVATTFQLSPAQRQHLQPAVTAWIRWSAAYRDLGEAATAHLLRALPQAFSRFDNAYDDRDCAMMRDYTADLAAPDANVSLLLPSMGRRLFALPLPERHDGPAPGGVGSPAERRALVEAEFGGCTPPAGLTSEQFVDAAHAVIEEIWQADPVSTFLTATSLSAEGLARHEIIHRLAGAPAPTRGASIVEEGFPDHSMSS
jgi:hypothetical protein